MSLEKIKTVIRKVGEHVDNPLLSGLIGAIVGALVGGAITAWVTFSVAKDQLRISKEQVVEMTKNHKEMLEVQRDLLEKSITASVRLMKSEQKIKLELAFLDELYDRLTKHVQPLHDKIHPMRNEWPDAILNTSKEDVKVRLRKLQDDLNQETKAFAELLNQFQYQGEFAKNVHREGVGAMTDLIHECETLIRKADQLGSVTRENIQFLMEDRERFNGKVTKWGDWIDSLRKQVHEKKAKLLADA